MATPVPRLISLTRTFVANYMSAFDTSHDFNHVLRVLSLSHQLLAAEQSRDPQIPYSRDVVTLAALLHDVGDRKYLPASAARMPDSVGPAESFLLTSGASEDLTKKVQKIISRVSYSHEIKNPDDVQAVIKEHPELAIVQDADRLDALGAIGIGRSFTYSASKRPEEGMAGVMRHFPEKLLKLPAMMKTVEGRRLGAIRGERIRTFSDWWMAEMKEELGPEGEGQVLG